MPYNAYTCAPNTYKFESYIQMPPIITKVHINKYSVHAGEPEKATKDSLAHNKEVRAGYKVLVFLIFYTYK